jgi:hypothetical protein
VVFTCPIRVAAIVLPPLDELQETSPARAAKARRWRRYLMVGLENLIINKPLWARILRH